MNKIIAALFFGAVVASVSAGYFDEHHEVEEHHEPKDYNYQYTVHDPHQHLYNSHQESSHGGVVKGYYSIKDADGSLREVHYTADKKNGFQAIVTKNGVQVHPHTGGSEGHHHQEASLGDFSSSSHSDFGGHDFAGHDFGGHDFSSSLGHY